MKHFPASGLLGLGFNTLSDGLPTFLDHLKSEQLIKDRSFSLYLTNDESFIAIDGMDRDYIKGNVVGCKLVNKYYWAVEL